MLQDTIDIGSKTMGKKVVATVQQPENIADVLALHKVTVPAEVGKWLATLPATVQDGITRCYRRGLNIERQDRQGRPMLEEGATPDAIRKAVAEYIPGTSAAVGRPRKPTTVEVEAKGGKVDAAALVEALKAKGITVNLK